MVHSRLLGAALVSVVIAITACVACVASNDDSSECGEILGEGGRALLAERLQVISLMTNALRTEGRSQMTPSQHYATFMLGELRADEEVPLLIEWLGAEMPCALTEATQEPYEYFPAAQALVKIGSRAVPALLAVAVNPEKPRLQRETAAWVMLQIERIEQGAYTAANKKVKKHVSERFSDARDDTARVALDFIAGYVEVEATFAEMPTLPDGIVFPRAVAGRKYEHRFRAKTPSKYPDAELTYKFYCVSHDQIRNELSMNASGDIVGTPLTPGVYEFQVTVTAKNIDKTTVASRMMKLYVVSKEEDADPAMK